MAGAPFWRTGGRLRWPVEIAILKLWARSFEEWGFGGAEGMNVLALDTSGDRAILGLAMGSGLVLESVCERSRRHGRDLIPGVRDLLRQAGARPADLDLIGVGLGPGSYTGMRIGLTAARTLAYATGARVSGFDSLEPFARIAPVEALRIVVVADAQRGDVYRADFQRPRPDAPLDRLGETRIESRADWAACLEPGSWVVGPGLESAPIREAIPAGVAVQDLERNRPTGRILLDLTREAFDDDPDRDPWTLEPNYLRRSAAEDQWAARGLL